MSAFTMPVVSIDCETTGLDVFNDRIVTLSFVFEEGPGARQGKVNWLIDPGVEIPDEVTKIHGISTEYAREHGRKPEEALNEAAHLLHNALSSEWGVVAYNAPYDLTLLRAEMARHGAGELPADIRPVFDPRVLDKQLDPFRKGSRRLDATASHYGVPLENAHTSEEDAIAALGIFRAMGSASPDKVDPHWLHDAQMKWAYEQQKSLEDYWKRRGDTRRVGDFGWPIYQRALEGQA